MLCAGEDSEEEVEALMAWPGSQARGDSDDNALAEIINGLCKAEVIHRRSWPTCESVELATLEWASWFNHHRLPGPIGYIPPTEAEANYHRHLACQTSTMGPDFNQPASTKSGAVQSALLWPTST